jgi:hypothetical protein
MNCRQFAPLLSFAAVALFSPADAGAVEIFTDRGEWAAAVGKNINVEDFANQTVGTFGTPYQTEAGFGFETPGMPILLQIRDAGVVNGSREMLIKDMGNNVIVGTPQIRRQLAIGFDWDTGLEAWQLRVSMQVIPLPANSSGFVGIYDPAGEIGGFSVTSPAQIQDGLAIDDLSYVPRILVFTDPLEWQAALPGAVTEEDFEGDAPGTYSTPWTTGGGCILESGAGAFDLEILDSGQIDGSRELHFADYRNQLSIRFPGYGYRQAVAFRWITTFETWDLKVHQESISLIGLTGGFMGIVDQSASLESIRLTSLSIVQEGISIDHLAFSSDPVANRPDTWGKLKARYQP